jgi:hypothetical protein
MEDSAHLSLFLLHESIPAASSCLSFSQLRADSTLAALQECFLSHRFRQFTGKSILAAGFSFFTLTFTIHDSRFMAFYQQPRHTFAGICKIASPRRWLKQQILIKVRFFIWHSHCHASNCEAE